MSAPAIRVLHVDDSADFGSLAALLLERGHEAITVETETDPHRVLERLADGAAAVDCILSDYDMPRLDGLELLEQVRKLQPDLPFILFTGKGSEEIAAEAIARGVDDYMQKETGTDHYEVLANRIRMHVGRVRTERSLKNNESRYRALVEQNLVGIYLLEDAQIAYANPRLEAIFGYDRGELIGHDALDIVAPVDRAVVHENIRNRFDGVVDSVLSQFTGLRKDGTELEVLAQGQVIEFDGEPAISGVLLGLDEYRLGSFTGSLRAWAANARFAFERHAPHPTVHD